jgi:phosphatidylglycerol:prolipoprotein diacylglycerol transferase
MTLWFDTDNWRQDANVTVQFSGDLREAEQADPGEIVPEGDESFSVTETVENVLAGTGRVAVTGRAAGIKAGLWQVNAEAVVTPRGNESRAGTEMRLQRVTASGETAFAPVIRARAPGARLGAWPAFVMTGFSVALIMQFLLSSRFHLDRVALFLVSLTSGIVGLACSKLYHRALHGRESGNLLLNGLGIQGFVLGAFTALSIGSLIAGIPIPDALDATAPGLLFGMAIGRLGCFFGGCCAGRHTRRFGLRSSDRRVAIRRMPVQLFESSVALGWGLASLLVVLLAPSPPRGLVFVGGLSGYVLGRQLLFPLRTIPRRTRQGRHMMIALTSAVLLGDIVWSVLG